MARRPWVAVIGEVHNLPTAAGIRLRGHSLEWRELLTDDLTMESKGSEMVQESMIVPITQVGV
jgi:hypothetical protein